MLVSGGKTITLATTRACVVQFDSHDRGLYNGGPTEMSLVQVAATATDMSSLFCHEGAHPPFEPTAFSQVLCVRFGPGVETAATQALVSIDARDAPDLPPLTHAISYDNHVSAKSLLDGVRTIETRSKGVRPGDVGSNMNVRCLRTREAFF